MNEKAIITMAEKMVESQGFSYSNFLDARIRLSIDNLFCDYDRMTLYVYKHNMDNETISFLYRTIKPLLSKRLNKEQKKEQIERLSLLCFLHHNIKYAEYIIEKSTRPDFVLTREKRRIGIEVTELILPEDKIAYSIMDDIDRHNCSKEEIRELINKKHGEKAAKYEIFDILGKTSVIAPLREINRSKECFIKKLVEKYEKYKDELKDFDEFIILCDERNVAIEISEDSDIKELVKIAKETGVLKNLTLSFLYRKSGCSSSSCLNFNI